MGNEDSSMSVSEQLQEITRDVVGRAKKAEYSVTVVPVNLGFIGAVFCFRNWKDGTIYMVYRDCFAILAERINLYCMEHIYGRCGDAERARRMSTDKHTEDCCYVKYFSNRPLDCDCIYNCFECLKWSLVRELSSINVGRRAVATFRCLKHGSHKVMDQIASQNTDEFYRLHNKAMDQIAGRNQEDHLGY